MQGERQKCLEVILNAVVLQKSVRIPLKITINADGELEPHLKPHGDDENSL